MEIKKLTDTELHSSIKKHVAIEKKYTHLVLKHLEEVERRKLHARMGHSTLMKYCEKELGYTSNEAWVRWSAMRLMIKDKEIEKKIEKNEISLSNASQIQAFAKREKLNKQETLSLVVEACGKSARHVENILKERSTVKEKYRFVRLSALCTSKLDRVKKMIGMDYGDAQIIEIVLDEKLREPQRRSKGASKYGRYIEKELKDFVYKRARHMCEYPGCHEKRFLQIDHVIPYAKGGSNTPENLRVLCSAHNQLERDLAFPKKVADA